MKTSYLGSDEALKQENIAARKFTQKYNMLPPDEVDVQFQALKGFLGGIGENSRILAPFLCDRGNQIFIGKHSMLNYGATLLDMGKIVIGDNVRIAPNCSIYTVYHPLGYRERADRVCYTEDVEIGDHTWIGGNVTILPGVHIGKRCVIGAGSLVTKNIPDDSLAYGSPCRVIRKLEENNE